MTYQQNIICSKFHFLFTIRRKVLLKAIDCFRKPTAIILNGLKRVSTGLDALKVVISTRKNKNVQAKYQKVGWFVDSLKRRVVFPTRNPYAARKMGKVVTSDVQYFEWSTGNYFFKIKPYFYKKKSLKINARPQ